MAPRRKTQTRLKFTPLPSSSPSKSNESSLSSRVRPATGPFTDPSRKPGKDELAFIPTPDTSSQLRPDSNHENKFAIGGRVDESEDEDEDEIESPAAKRRRTSSNRRATRAENPTAHPSPSQPITTVLSELGSPETGTDDDGIMATRPVPLKPRRRVLPTLKDDFVVSDNASISSPSDDEVFISTPRKSRQKSNHTIHTPRSRRLKSRRENRELKEDLDHLRDSSSPPLQQSRTRGGPVNRERERRRAHIELLKRRRAGEKEPTQLDSSEEKHEEEEEGPKDSQDFAILSSDVAAAAIFTKPSQIFSENSSSDDDGPLEDPTLDVDEDDFVVADEDEDSAAPLGRPHPDIPLEFTSYATAKPRELFVYVIEWLVKNKIAPAFARHDQLWKLAFGKIKDEITAQTGSRLKSSAWTSTFTNALNARPNLAIVRLVPDGLVPHGCDACNKTNRPAQYDFVFSGAAYDHDSLEPTEADSSMEDGEDDDDDDNNNNNDDDEQENASIDSQGRALPPLSTHFQLGRHCAANAELAHKLSHWKYRLNESVTAHLESRGLLSADEILRRARSKGGQPRREREAEQAIDAMQATGVIDDLWRAFRQDLQHARVGMLEHDAPVLWS